MQKVCKNCQNSFEISTEDLSFYEKLKSPAPNYCPPCRMQRRLAHRNERTLHKRTCSKTGKPIISIYPENTPFPVYDQHIWWGDEWDGMDYGQDYDPSRPFMEQWIELRNKVPRISLLSINCVNCDYTNNSEDAKNCYLIFAAQKNEDSMYGRLMYRNHSVIDCDFITDSELCYDSLDIRKSYGCLFCQNCEASTDCIFSFDLRDCQNCIFSTNLRHKSYHIYNQPVSREEFEAKKKEIFSSYTALEAARKEFERIKGQSIVKYANQVKCKNAVGDYLYNCHDTFYAFDAENAKNCKWMADAEGPIDSYDLNNAYYKPELCLDLMGVLQTYNCKHSIYIFYGSGMEYCDNVSNSDECFGCVGLRKKKYCILNKQYTKEEYEKLKVEIVEAMKREGTYGDFLPPEASAFGYNETLAYEYFPMEKSEAVNKGFLWQDKTTGTYGKETVSQSDMPETITEVTDDILREVLVCKDCKKNFRITQMELEFYRRMGLPLPRKDFECRHRDKMRTRNPRNFWSRECMCGSTGSPQATSSHAHGKENCTVQFQTAYSPDRAETVYCENCYQQEVS